MFTVSHAFHEINRRRQLYTTPCCGPRLLIGTVRLIGHISFRYHAVITVATTE